MDDELRKFVLEKRLKDAFISIEELVILAQMPGLEDGTVDQPWMR